MKSEEKKQLKKSRKHHESWKYLQKFGKIFLKVKEKENENICSCSLFISCRKRELKLNKLKKLYTFNQMKCKEEREMNNAFK